MSEFVKSAKLANPRNAKQIHEPGTQKQTSSNREARQRAYLVWRADRGQVVAAPNRYLPEYHHG